MLDLMDKSKLGQMEDLRFRIRFCKGQSASRHQETGRQGVRETGQSKREIRSMKPGSRGSQSLAVAI